MLLLYDIYFKIDQVAHWLQTLPDTTPPKGKIHPFRKIAVLFEFNNFCQIYKALNMYHIVKYMAWIQYLELFGLCGTVKQEKDLPND